MTSKLFNMACEGTRTVGSDRDVLLAGAMPSFLNFSQAGARNGDPITYSVEEGDAREIGRGLYFTTSQGQIVRREATLRSTNNNNPIYLRGTAQVSIVAAAEDLAEMFSPAIGNTGRNLVDNAQFNIWQRPFPAGETRFLVAPATPMVKFSDRWRITMTGARQAYVYRHTLTRAEIDQIGFERQFAQSPVPGGAVLIDIAHAGVQLNASLELSQRIENVTTVSKARIIVSFYAKTDTGTIGIGVSLTQALWGWPQAEPISGEPWWSYGSSPDIAVSILTIDNVFRRHSVALDIPSSETLNWTYTRGGTFAEVRIIFTDTRGDSQIGNQWGRITMTALQVEIARPGQSDASEFEIKDYATDLARCQRFYEIFDVGFAGVGEQSYNYRVTKRGPPSLTFNNIAPTNVSPSRVTANGFTLTATAAPIYGEVHADAEL